MVNGLKLKVCGNTTVAGATAAAESGADYLGFIFFPKSPRFLSQAAFHALAPRLPALPRVAVTVEPTVEELRALRAAGFARFQVHFQAAVRFALVEGWAEAVGRENLWLAPKLPPLLEVAPEWLQLVGTVMLDTYDPNLFGGSGREGDWGKFRRLRESRPDHTWILSGGLGPENVVEALRQTGATFLDVNSGVESAPGIKDPAKLAALAAAIRAAGQP